MDGRTDGRTVMGRTKRHGTGRDGTAFVRWDRRESLLIDGFGLGLRNGKGMSIRGGLCHG